jgi:hypothetical protein
MKNVSSGCINILGIVKAIEFLNEYCRGKDAAAGLNPFLHIEQSLNILTRIFTTLSIVKNYLEESNEAFTN